ncbi:chitosanase [Chitinophaga alhagiae]|uniref:chitosanase n=1 Tax=Chitinophaga alhagiae TaxID=2203219 RepID=UPI000E5A912C|nr:chitosanase [Chitinophaga alhagiae]
MITNEIKKKIVSIVNVFETGSAEGEYDALVIYPDGRGGSRQITYGRSQTTEQGNLRNLLERYISMGGSFAAAFQPYMNRVGRQSLVNDKQFIKLLKDSARQDPIMRQAQDETFERLYFDPAFYFFNAEGFQLPLSLLVIYDSFIHSGTVPGFLRVRFPERTPLHGGDEKSWVLAYTKARQQWLATHSKKVLHPTVYRTKTFLAQAEKDNWDLSAPVTTQGITIA